MALTHYQQLVPRFVRDQSSQITPYDIDRAVASAVAQYSADRPRELVRAVTWGGGHFGTAPAGFTVQSAVLQAEYPLGQVPAATVNVAAALAVDGTIGLVCEQALPAGAVMHLTFTAAHVLQAGEDAADDTVPAEHRDAVAMYAASLLLRELATHFSGERESSIGADGSNTESRARNYAQRSKDFRWAYFAALRIADPMGNGGGGASGGGNTAAAGTPAGAVASWPGRNRGWFRSNGRGL